MTCEQLHILLLSPFHGRSSHAAWAQGWQQHSRHRIEIVGLPDQAWAWRLKGGCVPLSKRLSALGEIPDVIVATSLTCLSSLFGLLRGSKLADRPLVYYMHENQLTYPIRQGAKRDAQQVLRQFHAQITADEVWFNSAYNRDCWLGSLPKFLERFADFQGQDEVRKIALKSKVVPVGLELPHRLPERIGNERPLFLWNQRWEWDKGTDLFLKLLRALGNDSRFDAVLLGETPLGDDDLRLEARELLGKRLLHEGWCPTPDYRSWLERADFTVSTSRHEFFGISVLESAARGLFTLAPRDLAYPEVLPKELHGACLYRSMRDLIERVRNFLDDPDALWEVRTQLAQAARRFAWPELVELYDSEVASVTRLRPFDLL